jgi:hypothetical protein
MPAEQQTILSWIIEIHQLLIPLPENGGSASKQFGHPQGY